MFTDTHCHLFDIEHGEDTFVYVNHAISEGVTKMIDNADNLETCYKVIEDAKNFDSVYFALGIHPSDCDDDFNELAKLVEENKDNKKLVAIGEIGLDYHYEDIDKDKQKELFRKQLELAEKYHLPVTVHSREATKDTIDILKEYPNVIGNIHCFSGSLETANEYIKMGYYIGVGGTSTFKNCNIKDVIKKLPLDRILLETDSPYLAPVPYRGTPNEPAYVKVVAKFLADYLDIPLEEISKVTQDNVSKLFLI